MQGAEPRQPAAFWSGSWVTSAPGLPRWRGNVSPAQGMAGARAERPGRARHPRCTGGDVVSGEHQHTEGESLRRERSVGPRSEDPVNPALGAGPEILREPQDSEQEKAGPGGPQKDAIHGGGGLDARVLLVGACNNPGEAWSSA